MSRTNGKTMTSNGEKKPAKSNGATGTPVSHVSPVSHVGTLRLKTGLAKTSSKLTEGITNVFTKRKLDAGTVE